MTWRAPNLTDPFVTDDVKEVFVGHRWIYFWDEKKMHVRRIDMTRPQFQDIVRVRRKPRTGLELAKVFFNKKMSRVYWNVNLPKPSQLPRPLSPGLVTRWEPSSLDCAQLSKIYERLVPAWPRGRVFTDHAAAVRRVEAALQDTEGGPWALVDRIPPLARAMTVWQRMHIVPSRLVEQSEGRSVMKPEWIVVKTHRMPMSPGTGRAERWERIRSGMTVGECLALGCDRGDLRRWGLRGWLLVGEADSLSLPADFATTPQ